MQEQGYKVWKFSEVFSSVGEKNVKGWNKAKKLHRCGSPTESIAWQFHHSLMVFEINYDIGLIGVFHITMDSKEKKTTRCLRTDIGLIYQKVT